MSRITFTRPDGTVVAVNDEATFLEALDAKFADWKNQIDLKYGSPINGWSEDASLLLNRTLTVLSDNGIEKLYPYQFYGFNQLTHVVLSNTSDIPEKCFAFNESLCSVVSTCTYVGANAFERCYSLVSVDLPNVEAMGASPFNDLYSVREMILPKLKTASTLGFRQSLYTSKTSGLRRLYAPLLTKLSSYGLNMCPTEKDAIALLPGFTEVVSKLVHYGTDGTRIVFPQNWIVTCQNKDVGNYGTFCVPANMLAQYREATNWSMIPDRLAAIEDYPDVLAYMAEVGYDYTPTTAEVSE